MFTLMAGEVFLQAAVLCGILYLVARHEADYSFTKVAMVVAAISLGTFLIQVFIAPHIGMFSLLVSVGFICFMLMTFCWITLRKSILVVALFSAFHIAMALIVGAVQAKVARSMQPTKLEEQAQDLADIAAELERQTQMQAGQFLAQPPPPDKALTHTEAVNEVTMDDAPPVAEPRATNPPVTPPPSPVIPVPAPASPAPAPALAMATANGHTHGRPVEDLDWKAARARLKIGGVMSAPGGRFAGSVNGTVVEAGDTVSARHNNKRYRWRVAAITRSGVVLEPLDIVEK